MRTTRKGYSLVEVVVAIGLIGILVGLSLPAVNKSRDAAVRLSCQNNLKQIGIALQNYHDTNSQLPPLPTRVSVHDDPNALLGWMALILPQIEQENLYQISVEACRIDPDPIQNPPHVGFATVIGTYICPADARLSSALTDRYGVTASFASYIGIEGEFPPGTTQSLPGVFGSIPGARFSDITDGLSQTIMVSERPPPDSLQAGWWYPWFIGDGIGRRGPNNIITLGGALVVGDDQCVRIQGTLGPGRLDNPCDRFHLWSLHVGGANFLFADGSVKFLPYSTPSMTILALASRSGGEALELP